MCWCFLWPRSSACAGLLLRFSERARPSKISFCKIDFYKFWSLDNNLFWNWESFAILFAYVGAGKWSSKYMFCCQSILWTWIDVACVGVIEVLYFIFRNNYQPNNFVKLTYAVWMFYYVILFSNLIQNRFNYFWFFAKQVYLTWVTIFKCWFEFDILFFKCVDCLPLENWLPSANTVERLKFNVYSHNHCFKYQCLHVVLF